jgi:drug/metabolite transporter (DMT)-like permease
MAECRTVKKPSATTLGLVVVAGFLAVSFGSILVKLIPDAPGLTVAFFRMFWASLILLPFYLRHRPEPSHGESTRPIGRLWWGISGIALALHFAFWIGSLYYTSVAVSVLMVNTAPVATAVLSYLLFGERLTKLGLVGLSLAMGGAVLLLWNDLQVKADWRGAALALAGALMLGCYLIAGRRIRRNRSLLGYVYPTYALAMGVLLLLVLLSGQPLMGFEMETYGLLFLLGAFPQCVGHTSYNWVLKYLSATVVATLALAEPIGASLLAYWILGENITILVVIGGCVVLAGILLVSLRGPGAQPSEKGEQ